MLWMADCCCYTLHVILSDWAVYPQPVDGAAAGWMEISIVSLLLASYRLSPPGDELGRGTGQGEEQPAGQVTVPVVAG